LCIAVAKSQSGITAIIGVGTPLWESFVV